MGTGIRRIKQTISPSYMLWPGLWIFLFDFSFLVKISFLQFSIHNPVRWTNGTSYICYVILLLNCNTFLFLQYSRRTGRHTSSSPPTMLSKGRQTQSPPPLAKLGTGRRSPSPPPPNKSSGRPSSSKSQGQGRSVSPPHKPPMIRRTPSPSPRTTDRVSPGLRRRSPSPKLIRSYSDDSNVAESIIDEVADNFGFNGIYQLSSICDLAIMKYSQICDRSHLYLAAYLY